MDERNNILVEEKSTQEVEKESSDLKNKSEHKIFSSAKTGKCLTVLASLVCLYGLYYWGTPAVVNIQKNKTIIEQTIFKETGYKASIQNPSMKMGLLPSVWLKAEAVNILNDDNTKALSIDSPLIKINLIPLMAKHIDIANFTADNITANFVFDKDSKLKLGQYPIKPINQKIPLKLNSAKIKLNSYNVNLDDQIQNKQIKLNGAYLCVNDFKQDKQLSFATLADLHVGKKASYIKANVDLKLPVSKVSDDQLEISGHIVNLNLADFSIYANSLSKGKIKSLSGLVNFTAKTTNTEELHKQVQTELTLKNLGILQDDIASSMYFKDKLTIKTNLTTFKNGINIEEMSINGNGVSASVYGKIKKLNSKLPDLNLHLSVNETKIENLLPLLPGEKDLSPDIDLHLLKQTGFWGRVIGNLDIKGKADFPDVNGNILISDGYLLKPIPDADKATIKISFKGQKLDLDVKVPTSKTEAVYVKGPIQIYKDKNADLNITSTNNVDLKTAQIVLNPLHDILHFDIGPVPVMDIKGKGGINLHVVGTRKNPHGWGQFHFNNATVSFLDIHNMTLTNGSGLLSFDDQNTKFITKSASLNGKPVNVEGTCSLQGNLNFKVDAKGQNLANMLKIIKTSPMLADIQKLISPIKDGSGNVNVFINLTGQVKDVKDIQFNKNLFAKGNISLLSNNIKLKQLPAAVSNVKGNVKFDNLNAEFKLASKINRSEININGKIKDNNCNTKVISNKFYASDAILMLPAGIKIPYKNDIMNINSSFIAKYNGSLENIELNKVFLKGKIYSNKAAAKNIIVNSSSFELNNSNFKLSPLRGNFKGSPFLISADITNLFDDKNRSINGTFNVQNLDLNAINDSNLKTLLKPEHSKIINDCKNIQGKINLAAKVRNNNISAYTALNNLSLVYQPKRMLINIKSGNILLHNDDLNLNKLNAKLGVMPVFINGKITNIYGNPYLNLYVNAKPTQEFFDQFFNYNSVYPIKVKGDIMWSSNVRGPLNKINTQSELNVSEDSRIYYMGASIGDVENPVKISINNTYSPNKIKINHLQYDKIISSQNNKPFVNTQLNASGTINLLANNNIGFNNFRIKTETPTDAKIFNIIFRKPIMKQGVFTSDLILNGTAANPKIQGKLDVTSIDMPFFDSTVKDVNLEFKGDKIYITSHGTVLTNDILLNAVMKNKLMPPYIMEDVKLKLVDLNINKITDMMREMEVNSSRNPSGATANIQTFDPAQVIIKKAEVTADKIHVRNIIADKFKADLNINDKKILNVNKFKFNIAQGTVLGSMNYNLLNRHTNLDVHLDKANSAIMAEALFDLKGQIYGLASGDIKLACDGTTHDSCFKTLSGEGYFSVDNGRIPKLGSLEYLLKAGNLLKGGITGLSINSLIDLITPLKTGDFDSISGDFHISDGIAQKINIYSDGKDLNMYMTGSYNFVNSIADMQIYGSLTKNITSVFGKVKNASLNTLFNMIPGINNSDETILLQEGISKIPNITNASKIYRIFRADIYGDINGEGYVRSFKWVK